MAMKSDTLIEALISGDDGEAEKAAIELGRLCRQSTEILPRLVSLFESQDPDHRWWALRVLAEVPLPESQDILLKGLQDDAPTVRQCAALGLVKKPISRAIPLLIAMLEEEDRQSGILAGKALAKIGAEAVPGLIDVVERGRHPARLEAVRALAEIGDPRAISVFFKAIQDGDSSLVEYWSEIGLERLGFGMTFFNPS